METKTLGVDGMSCQHCAAAVTKAVNSVAGAKKAVVDLKGNSVTFQYDPAKLDFARINEVIREAGFEVRQAAV